MSAVAPATPPHPVLLSKYNPQHSERRDSVPGDMSAGTSNRHTNGYGKGRGPGASSAPLPHIKDLLAKAVQRVDPNLSAKRLLTDAEQALRNADGCREFGSIAEAYTEFLVCAHILVEVLRTHKEAPELRGGSLGTRRNNIAKRFNAVQGIYEQIQDSIEADNERHGTLQTTDIHQQSRTDRSDIRPASVQGPPPPPPHTQIPPELQRRSMASAPSQNGVASEASHAKSRPPINPKPQNLHSTPLPTNGKQSSPPNVDALAQRFAGLRPRDQTSRDAETVSVALQRPPYPTSPQEAPRSRSQMSVSTQLPKAPSPTYTPTRSEQSPATIKPPRSSRYQMPSTNDRRTSVSSNASVAAGDRNSGGRGHKPKQKSMNLPHEFEITADKLYDFVQTFKVLLIDVRSREEFDQGSIYHGASICIEPTALRPNMSAEQLEEALVLAPEGELEFFAGRDEFDLVVYFDQSTPDASFLNGNAPLLNPSLRYLHDALYTFNDSKPLRWPPSILKGGLDAWIDLLGSQALKVSNTAHKPKASRPISRRPLASAQARLNMQKRRHREYNPMDVEEEKKWRERARSESIVIDQQPRAEDSEAESVNGEIDTRPIDEFNERYPDVGVVEQSVAAAASASQNTSHSHSPYPDTRQLPSYPRPPTPQFQPRTSSRAATPQSAPPPPLPQVPVRPAPAVPRPSYTGVSERMVSPASNTAQRQQLTPYIPLKLKRVPKTGLTNFGATCYMNATLQCLSATIPLTNFFLDDRWRRYVQPENWKGSKGLLPEYYFNLIKNLWSSSSEVEVIRPTNFRAICGRLNREWGSERQQDAKEYLEFLVDCLHEDLNENWRRTPLRALTEREEADREAMPPFRASKIEWNRYLHRDTSQMVNLFGGQHLSRLTCTTCRHSSTTYEPFFSISVEIPTAPSRSNITIHDCLRSYCSAETLAGDEVWRCPHCKTQREATKRITITRAPEFLIVHFKRFSAGRNESTKKIHTAVDFPLKGLDISRFVLPPPTPKEQHDIASYAGSKELEAPPSMQGPYRYDCYAVMRHLGQTMTSGHYIALVRDQARGVWREFNDDRTNDFRPEKLDSRRRLQNEQAYIVFYQRVRDVEGQ